MRGRKKMSVVEDLVVEDLVVDGMDCQDHE